MKYYLIAQLEVAYLKNNRGDFVRKYFPPKQSFFFPGVWEFESFPKDYYLKTISFEDFKKMLQED